MTPSPEVANYTAPGGSIEGYSSEDGGLMYEPQHGKRVYYRWHMEQLSEALAPMYIRYVDVERYGAEGQRLVRGVLFTYKAPHAKMVTVAGNFSGWQPKAMKRNNRGVWFFIAEPAGRYQPDRNKYLYKFNIDGIWDYDRENRDRISDSYGSMISRFSLGPGEEDVDRHVTVRRLPAHMQKDPRRDLYEFRLFRPKAGNVFIVGNFNNWNPDHDPLMKGEDGIWRLRMYLNKGEYLYGFIVDGKRSLDDYNPEVRLDAVTGKKASFLVVQ